MMVLGKFTLIVGLGLVLNLAVQTESHFLSCNAEHLQDSPQCPTVNNPELKYFPVPNDCRSFFECINGQAKCLRCPSGTIWDQQRSFCTDERSHICEIEDVTEEASTVETPLPTDPPRTTTTTTPQPPSTVEQEFPTTTEPVTELPPELPTTELAETDPPITEVPTEPPITEVPTESPTTQGTTKQTTTGPTTSTRPWNLCPIDDPMPPPEICPPQEQIPTYLPYPYDCQKYFQCSNGVAFCMRCANGTVWDQEHTICDREANVGCNIVTTTLNYNHQRQNSDIFEFFKKFNFPRTQ